MTGRDSKGRRGTEKDGKGKGRGILHAVYITVVAVKKLVVGFLLGVTGPAVLRDYAGGRPGGLRGEGLRFHDGGERPRRHGPGCGNKARRPELQGRSKDYPQGLQSRNTRHAGARRRPCLRRQPTEGDRPSSDSSSPGTE